VGSVPGRTGAVERRPWFWWASSRGARLLRAGLGILAALLTVPLTLARAIGGGTPYPAPVLAAVSPYGVLTATVALVLASWARLWWLCAAAAALLLVHLLWIVPSLVGGQCTTGDRFPGAWGGGRCAARDGHGEPVTVMVSNAYLGRADAGAMVQAVRERRVDVLVVPELTAELRARLRAAGLDTLLPWSLLDPQPGASGTGLWSRFPGTPLAQDGPFRYAVPRARLTLPGGGTLTMTGVHLVPPFAGQLGQWKAELAALGTQFRATQGAAVIAGDFNTTRDHAGFRQLLATGLRDAADSVGAPSAWPGNTWPANRWFGPVMRIDHVLGSRGLVVARSVRTVRIPGTDHLAVVAGVQVVAPRP